MLQVVYSSSKAAKLCAEKLNRTSKMGNIMNVFVDTLGKPFLSHSLLSDCVIVKY